MKSDAEPHIGGEICIDGEAAGKVTAGAVSSYLQHGIGIALMDRTGFSEGDAVSIRCIDGQMRAGELVGLPLYDRKAEVPRGKLVNIPRRPE